MYMANGVSRGHCCVCVSVLTGIMTGLYYLGQPPPATQPHPTPAPCGISMLLHVRVSVDSEAAVALAVDRAAAAGVDQQQ